VLLGQTLEDYLKLQPLSSNSLLGFLPTTYAASWIRFRLAIWIGRTGQDGVEKEYSRRETVALPPRSLPCIQERATFELNCRQWDHVLLHVLSAYVLWWQIWREMFASGADVRPTDKEHYPIPWTFIVVSTLVNMPCFAPY